MSVYTLPQGMTKSMDEKLREDDDVELSNELWPKEDRTD